MRHLLNHRNGWAIRAITSTMACLFTSGFGFCQVDDTKNRMLEALVFAYPQFIEAHDGEAVVFKDGDRMTLEGETAFVGDVLRKTTLRDMFRYVYPTGSKGLPPEKHLDPGRIRHEPFFQKMYGDCRKGEVDRSIISLKWLEGKWGGIVKVTRVNGVAEKLLQVSKQLERLPPEFDKYLFPVYSTYNCRLIGGTDRQSSHAYGIAIDLSFRYGNYWRRSGVDTRGNIEYKNGIPYQIVEIFEAHGFIWGGRWYHYDTLHFEYRPELLLFGR